MQFDNFDKQWLRSSVSLDLPVVGNSQLLEHHWWGKTMFYALVGLLLGVTFPERVVMTTVENASFPIIVHWDTAFSPKVAAPKLDEQYFIAVEGTENKVPEGAVSLWVEPPDGTFVTVRYIVNGDAPSAPQFGRYQLQLKKDDKLTIRCGEFVADWNAAIVAFRGYPLLVRLEPPAVVHPNLEWHRASGSSAKYPNALYSLAGYGAKEHASITARYVSLKLKPVSNGRIALTDEYITVQFPVARLDRRDQVQRGVLLVKDDPVAREEFTKELSASIEVALKEILRHHLPSETRTSIADEMTRAKQELAWDALRQVHEKKEKK
jgi:hypothetical protein